MGHQNREAMVHVGVHVELTVRLGRGVEGFHSSDAYRFGCCNSRDNPRHGWGICVALHV